MAYSIRAGVRIEEKKNTKGLPFEDIPEPCAVRLQYQSLSVQVGDVVKKWQKIGENDGMPLYASVSGKIIEAVDGIVTLENDFSSLCEDVLPVQKLIKELSEQEIRDNVKNAAIYSGGKPAHELIYKADFLVINLLESEPYLCSLRRLAVEFAAEIIGGAKILMKACGVRKAFIAVEKNKKDAVKALSEAIGDSQMFKIKCFKSKYPQDEPGQIVYALGGKETGVDRTLKDAGYAVFDGFCCVDTYRALAKGIPAVARYITADGDCITTPKNLCVPVGTPASHIAEYCGGLSGQLYKLIQDGPMRGKTLYGEQCGVGAHAKGIIFMSEAFEKKRVLKCIRCGRCSAHCPMYLMPPLIVEGGAQGADSCISCGVCSYVCPSNIPLTQLIDGKKK